MRISLIIAAGGSGSRFKAGKSLKTVRGAKQPATKLFFPLAGSPLLLRTLRAFQAVPEIKETIVALPPGVDGEVKNWIREHGLRGVICVRGGKTRAESVLRALKRCSSQQTWVMIHDGARPFIQAGTIQKLARQAERKSWEACLIAKKVIPTIKQALPGVTSTPVVERTVDRSRLYEAETPQLFRRASLLKAYRSLSQFNEAPTDEASLMEFAGYPVHLVVSEEWNPKITTVSDFTLAEGFMSSSDGLSTRMGLGSDTHRLIAGRPFWLGGLRLKSEYGPLGHSDGDALLHAVIDALLGAAALGDIGDFFSDKDPKNKDRSSSDMLRAALKKLRTKGWKPCQVDAVVHLERPRLGPIKKQMAARMATLLDLPLDCISIKAKTFEGDGTGGAGLLVRCEVLAVIQRS